MADAWHLGGVAMHQQGRSEEVEPTRTCVGSFRRRPCGALTPVLEQALPFIQKAVVLRPVFTTGYNNLGNVYFKMGPDPYQPTFCANSTALTVVCTRVAGRLPQAIKAFKQAISQNATNTNARVGLGEAYIAAGQYQDAEDTARAAVDGARA